MARNNVVGSVLGMLVLAVLGYYVWKTVLPKLKLNSAIKSAQNTPYTPADQKTSVANALQSIRNIVDAANSNQADGRNPGVDAANEATSGLSAIYYDPTIVQGT